jgi:cysteine synthase
LRTQRKRIVEKSVIIEATWKYRNWFSNGSCGKRLPINFGNARIHVRRRRLMSIYGAEFCNTPRKRNERSHRKAKEMSEELPNAWLPLQFDNPANIEIHKTTTAQEIKKTFLMV